MKRRLLLLGTVLATVAVFCTGSGTISTSSPASPSPSTSGSSESPLPRRPDLVLILTDDQRTDTLWAMPEVRLLLARHGVTFTNFFVTTSDCCPSRASILSGQYSRHTGVFDNSPPNGGAPAFHDQSTLATWLKAAGYTTGLEGKYLNAYALLGQTYIPPGWDDWHVLANKGILTRYYNYTLNENGRLVSHRRPDDYSTTYLANRAIAFIRTAPGPFFLYYAPIAPHNPAIPAPQDAHRFDNLRPYRPPSFDELDASDKPWRALHPRMSMRTIGSTDVLRRRVLGTLQAVDRAVAGIVQALTAKGVLDNTIIAFTSDNGFLWGEHRLSRKVWPYEESIRVPLVVRTPWQQPPGRTDSHLVLNVDLASTFAELAGVTPGLPQDGRSLVPLLRGERVPWRDEFVVEFLGHSQLGIGGPPPFEGLRTTRYLYVEYRNGWRELYDLAADPFELHNLVGAPGTGKIESSLAGQLRTLLARAPG